MVVAPVTGALSGRVAILVGEELVAALETDPSGVLSLAAVLQPTVDAVTEALGANAGPAQEAAPVDLAAMLSDQYTAVPLLSMTGFAAAIVLTDGLLVQPPAPEEVVVAARWSRLPPPRSSAASRCCTAWTWRSPSSSAGPG